MAGGNVVPQPAAELATGGGVAALELLQARDDPEELSACLRAFEARDPAARRELGRRLREHVAAHHSADSWADGILAAAKRT